MNTTRETTLTEWQIDMLGAMAMCHLDNAGRLPATMKELADHWYEMSDRVVVKEHIDEDGHHHPPATVFEVDAPDHCLECTWLRRLQKRRDAAALLAVAIKKAREARRRSDHREPF